MIIFNDDREKVAFEEALETIKEFASKDVLPLLYSLNTIEKYVAEKRKSIVNEIDSLFVGKKQFFYTDSGEPAELNGYFFEDNLHLKLDVASFRRYISSKTRSSGELELIYSQLCNPATAIIRIK